MPPSSPSTLLPSMRLEITDYLDETRWRWALFDGRGRFLADHPVQLDPSTAEYRGFVDLRQYLDFYQPVRHHVEQLAALGDWIGEQVFGGVLTTLRQQQTPPATPVHLLIPAAAQRLLSRPFELARFGDGDRRSFGEAGIRFIYQPAAAAATAPHKAANADRLRLLAVFSLPDAARPLNLRRERYQLQQLVHDLTRNQGKAVELQIVQYGATRELLRQRLEEGEGWDLIHLSGHGREGELLLETADGKVDAIRTEELLDLLRPAQARLKLLLLDSCLSAAGSQAAARAQLDLDRGNERRSEGDADASSANTSLPSLAQRLAEALDCAAVAMRYPVEDSFACDLMLALYDKLLVKQQALPAALQLALNEALRSQRERPPLASVTPVCVGKLAAELRLPLPSQQLDFSLPQTGLGIGFPPQPARFVGRLGAMTRASLALAPRSPQRGVFFYGMPGAGKSACALELAYRHESNRFRGYVWYKAPDEGHEIQSELFNLLFEIERQLNAPKLGLTASLDDPTHFRSYTLPRLRSLLQNNSLLLVLDNLESLLSASDQWRDPLWGELLQTLLSHEGSSRLILTARRLPADLKSHPRLLCEPIHALSLAESVLLARELPHLNALFGDEAGRSLLHRTLHVVQGHPKLLELANALAAERAALERQVQASNVDLLDRSALLAAFFAVNGNGETRQSDSGFVAALQQWTAGVSARLPASAQFLLVFLARLEETDRSREVLDANWQDFLKRLSPTHPDATALLARSGQALPEALETLERAGLIASTRPSLEPAQQEQLLALLAAQNQAQPTLNAAGLLDAMLEQATTYSLHPGVAESVRAHVDSALLDATDIELGDYHYATLVRTLKTEMEGGSRRIAEAGRRGAPYLLRQQRWEEASTLIEHMLLRDKNPATLAWAIPLLRQIVAATAGSERAASYAGVLASALADAGCYAEAEAMERKRIKECITQGNFRLASVAAGQLLNLLREGGRLEQALAVADEKAEYSRRAGVGVWNQLLDETQRLQVLNALGRTEEVLARVQALRPKLATLPNRDEDGGVNPWNVREGLLDTGREAAQNSEQWSLALELNAERVQAKVVRAAGALEVARTRFNDYGPLLRLQRYDDAFALLQGCRQVFEAAHDIPGLGKVYSALADLEDERGDRRAASDFEQLALRYSYQVGDPEDCAISHNNLANYLEGQQADPALVLAQRLAAAALRLQINSGLLRTTLNNLANSELPPTPPSFAAVTQWVEQTPGVRFAELFARLPPRLGDGDAVIAKVWELVGQAKAERQQRQQEQLQQFEPLLQTMAAIAHGDDSQRAEVEARLADLEEKGWHLQQPVTRIWAGERDRAALTAGLDIQDKALIERLLGLVG